MKTSEKIQDLRKKNNMTQEQLADYLSVSRQSVSKWESGIAYPETEKIIKLSKLFNCSIDYLLNDEAEKDEVVVNDHEKKNHLLYFEYSSKLTIKNIKLIHICFDPKKTAKGIIAIGFRSIGIISLGLLSLGFLSVGVLSLGIIALGCLCLGVFSAGAIAIGVVSLGAIAIGALLSVGAFSVGNFAVGALAFGNYMAVGDRATAKIAIGKTSANGSIYGVASAINDIGKDTVRACIESDVPKGLRWLAYFILSLI